MRAVVVGSTNVDLVLTVPALPVPGETALATASRREAGGKGGNQAVALARLGATVTFVSAVGDDEHGRWSLEQLPGIDLSQVRVVDAPTGTAVVVVDGAAENLIVVDPGANLSVTTPTEVEADVLLLSLEIPMAAAVASARAARCPVVLNAAPAQPLPAELLEHVDVVVLNEHELAVVGLPDGPRAFVVTRGAEGCRVIDADGTHDFAAAPCEVVDTTGAGDCFSAALAFGIGSGWSLDRAVDLALLAAARAVERPGARGGLPLLADLEGQ
jgi:ribokinase